MIARTRARPRRAAALMLITVLAGCVTPNGPTPEGSTVAPSVAESPSEASLPAAVWTPTAAPVSTPTPTPAPTPVVLPDGLEAQAWATATGIEDTAGTWVSSEIAMGLLGRPTTASVSLPRTEGYARIIAAGPYAIVIVQGDLESRVRVYRAADGALVAEHVPHGRIDEQHVAVDPAGGVLYAGVALAGGGVEIRRLALDGSASTTLFSLDDRFTSAGVPTDHYGLVVATDRRLVVAACADGECRLWRIGAGAAAGVPMTLPAGTPELCSLVGATDQWLVVYDKAMCSADTGDAPFPLRGISLANGQSFRITDASQVIAHRVLVIDGRAVVVAGHRSTDWSTTDVETWDVRTGSSEVLVRGLANGPDGTLGWIGVSAQQLPVPWVLLEPWGIDPTGPSTLPTRLLDVATGRLIELPLGTAGWTS
jgi:hypothetical protein